MKIQLVITVDTEEDQWDRYTTDGNTVENIAELISLQKIFDSYNAVPTYLVNWPVATKKHSIYTLKKLIGEHNCEVGTHCHPWNTPPFSEEINQKNSMMCNLPYELVKEKMTRLHEEIIKNLGVTPRCFRAGRWGFGSGVAGCLRELGYEIDTSVTPYTDWTEYGGVNYRGVPVFPYYLHPDNVFQECEHKTLLEVPASIGYLQQNFELCDRWRTAIAASALKKIRILGVLDRLKVLNYRWLSPELSTGKDMVKLIKVLVKKGHKVLNLSFHSTALLPGKTPFVKDQGDVEFFREKIECVLKYCVEQDIDFVPLSAVNK